MCPVYHLGRSRKRVGDRLKLVTFRVKCFIWIEKEGPGVKPHTGFGFASDISESGAGFYIDTKIPKATTVKVAFEEESNPAFRATVAWCHRYSLRQQFQGHESLDHRAGLEFRFDSEADQQRYLMFFNELRQKATALKNEFRF